jgi:hypothetical protein
MAASLTEVPVHSKIIYTVNRTDVHMAVFGVMITCCGLVDGNEHFGRTHCVRLEGLTLYDIPGHYNLLINHISTREIKTIYRES